MLRRLVHFVSGPLRLSTRSIYDTTVHQFLTLQLNSRVSAVKSLQTSAFRLSDFDIMAETKFAADYAKRVAGCKKCKAKIEKNELRIAKCVPNFFHDGEGEMKQYHHPKCLFETFIKARATTKVIQEADDIQGFTELKQEDKDSINQLIKETMEKKGAPKTPKKAAPRKNKSPAAATATPGGSVQTKMPQASPAKAASTSKTPTPTKKPAPAPSPSPSPSKPAPARQIPPGPQSAAAEKDNAFRQFRRLCADIADEPSYLGKTKLIQTFLKKGSSGDGYEGDTYILMKLLLPGVVKTVYNLNNKQLVKIFSQIFQTDLEEMQEDLEQGDVAETVRQFYEKSNALQPQKKSTLSLHEVDEMLTDLSNYTKEDDQQRALTRITKRSTANDLKMTVRLIKHDLRINSGAKHILDALDPNAYMAFKASRDLRDVVDRVLALTTEGDTGGKPGVKKTLSIKASVMTPVQPMLAEACKSVEMAFRKCPNGMYSEIKYDGERVQVHKHGDEFQYFSRSLKPVLAHKVQHFKDYIPAAFQNGNDLILDAEVLLIDTNTSKPLPFGTLGVHKKQAFQDANVALFVFDCIHYNGESLMTKPIKERRKILHKNMTEIPNRILFSEYKHITVPSDLKEMLMKVFREGLEGLVLKDVNSQYEPGKRHWLKVKKDYLAEGAMADTADLVVLGAYIGTGNKGGLMSIFLMGVHNPDTGKWLTVSKCGSGFDDRTLEKLQKQFDMVKISKDYNRVPTWLNINRNLVPDYVVADPKKSSVWEITGAEFSKSESHTADGISIRFPRLTKMRHDKTWKEATNLNRLRDLYKISKQYSDIPDVYGVGKAKAVPKAEDSDSASSRLDADDDVIMGGPATPKKEPKSTPKKESKSTPQKSPVKRKAADDDGEMEVKKERKESQKSPCKYGANCYQKNPDHKANFSHSSNNATRASKTLPDVFSGMKILVPDSVDKRDSLTRYIIAFDGDIVEDFEASSATHIVSDDKAESGSSRHISASWLWTCIKNKKLVPQS